MDAGDYTVSVKVTTDLGVVNGNSDPITVEETAGVDATISKPTGAPTAATSYGGTDGSIAMTARITKDDAIIKKVEYQVNEGVITDVGSTISNVSFEIPNLSAGSYTVKIIVTTDLGGTIEGTSDPITVGQPDGVDATIPDNPTGIPTIASYGGTDGSIDMSATVTLNNAIITKIEYQVNSEPAVDTLSIDKDISFNIPNLAKGDYTITLIVTTDLGGTTGTSDPITVGEVAPVDATISKPIGTPTDTSYGGTDGSIDMSATVTLNDAIITKIRYRVDDEPAVDTLSIDEEISFNIPNLDKGDYTITIIVTTDLGEAKGVSNPITVGEAAPVDATISKPTGTPTDAIYGGTDGSIDMSATVTLGDATITKIQYQVNSEPAVDTLSIDKDISFNIPNLAKGDHTITIIVTTDLVGVSKEITGISDPITVGYNQETIPIVDPEGSTTTPTENSNGTITYPVNSITTVITTGDDSFVSTNIGETAQYEIVDSEGNALVPPIFAPAAYNATTATFSLNGELIIDATTVNSGYSIILTGVTYNSVEVPNINVETIESINTKPTRIALIVIVSLLGVGVLASGSALIISKITKHNKGHHEDKEEPNSQKSSYSKREDYGIKYEDKK